MNSPLPGRICSVVKQSVYRRRESDLAILLAALRLCESRALVVAAREALKR